MSEPDVWKLFEWRTFGRRWKELYKPVDYWIWEVLSFSFIGSFGNCEAGKMTHRGRDLGGGGSGDRDSKEAANLTGDLELSTSW